MKLFLFEKSLFVLMTSVFCNVIVASSHVDDQTRMVHDMFHAIEAGDLATVKELVGHNPEIVNIPKEFAEDASRLADWRWYMSGWTPLHAAIASSKRNIVEFLVRKGANVSFPSKHLQMTPLHRSVHAGSYDIAQFLIDHGADLEAETEDGQLPRDLAVRRGDTEMAGRMISPASLIDAIYAGDVAAVQKHLEAKPKLAKTSSRRRRKPFYPLTRAMKMPVLNRDIIELLLDNGAKANINIDVYGTKPLHLAARRGNIEIAKMLIAHGARVNEMKSTGHRPLHEAIENGNLAVVELLVNNGANVNAAFTGGRPLHAIGAAIYSNPLSLERKNELKKIAEFLIAHGADVNSRMLWGKDTPLHMVCTRGLVGVAQTLIDHGADINAQGYYRFTPLHYAVHIDWSQDNQMKLELVKFLLSQGADIESVNKKGETPLALALKNNNRAVAEYLIMHYANVGRLQEGLQSLSSDLLKKRHTELTEILDDFSLKLPAVLQKLVIEFVTEA